MKEIKRKQKIGLFPMCADVIHAGHILALKEAKENCDYLIVALNTHPDGKQPVQTVWERSVQLSAVKYVDSLIVYQGKEDMEKIAAYFQYDVRFLGDDYLAKEWDGKASEECRGITPYFVNRSHCLSSTELKNRIVRANKRRTGNEEKSL